MQPRTDPGEGAKSGGKITYENLKEKARRMLGEELQMIRTVGNKDRVLSAVIIIRGRLTSTGCHSRHFSGVDPGNSLMGRQYH